MSDVVVCVPSERWRAWLEEGDLPGEPPSGRLYEFALGTGRPRIKPGERVYIVAQGHLRGYAPLVELRKSGRADRWVLIRGGGAVAVTIPQHLTSFQGFRYRWWMPGRERPFLCWRFPAEPLSVMGARVRVCRLTRGWTQVELSARAGFAQTEISEIERGLWCPWPEQAVRLAAALEIPAEELDATLSEMRRGDCVRRPGVRADPPRGVEGADDISSRADRSAAPPTDAVSGGGRTVPGPDRDSAHVGRDAPRGAGEPSAALSGLNAEYVQAEVVFRWQGELVGEMVRARLVARYDSQAFGPREVQFRVLTRGELWPARREEVEGLARAQLGLPRLRRPAPGPPVAV
jgi:transcriptional regulator with XRE-family HTH domain